MGLFFLSSHGGIATKGSAVYLHGSQLTQEVTVPLPRWLEPRSVYVNMTLVARRPGHGQTENKSMSQVQGQGLFTAWCLEPGGPAPTEDGRGWQVLGGVRTRVDMLQPL